MTTSTGYLHGLLSMQVVDYRNDSGNLVPAIWGGAIGGITVLAGVLLAEWLNLKREAANRFGDAYWNVMAQSTNILAMGPLADMKEIFWRSSQYLVELGKLHSAARWPLYNHKEVLAEVKKIVERFQLASTNWRNGGAPPTTEAVLGTEIGLLARESSRWPRWWRNLPPGA
ncbi:MAG: hypothetical protein WA860_02060 [Acidimicrobiales bacterium]